MKKSFITSGPGNQQIHVFRKHHYFIVLHLKLYGCVAESCDGQERLFVLRLDVPVKNFSVMSGRSQSFLGFNQYFRELMCLAQGHNTVPHVGIEPRTS